MYSSLILLEQDLDKLKMSIIRKIIGVYKPFDFKIYECLRKNKHKFTKRYYQ